jgi:hypothetical protein
MVKVATIREGHEFEDLDYPDEGEGIEKRKDAKGYFILWPYKDIILDPIPYQLFCCRAERMRVLQLLKIPYAALPDLLLHLKILHKLSLLFKIHHKLPLLPKIHHLHNLLSIILLSIVLLHIVILQSLLLTLPLLFKILHKQPLLPKIHYLHNLLSIILLSIILLHMVILKVSSSHNTSSLKSSINYPSS